VISTLAVDGWAVTFGTAMRGLGGAAASPVPSSLYQIVTAYPSTASVPITVLLYNNSLLWSFNAPIKGLTFIKACILSYLPGISLQNINNFNKSSATAAVAMKRSATAMKQTRHAT